MVNAQEWLDKNYPKEERNKKTKLHISNKELKGDLVFIGFDNLERLDCSENELTSLDISSLTALKEVNCYTNRLTKLITNNPETSSRLEKLEYLDCTNNYLTDINSLLLGLNHNKLRKFYLSDNTFSTSDLIPFSKFVNLEELTIASNYYRKDHDKGIANRFVGSLKPLKNLTKLRCLGIENTDIDSGLECLPESLENFWCYDSNNERLGAKATNLYWKELRKFGSNKFSGNISSWREFHNSFQNSPAQKWLDEEYPESKERSEIIKLSINETRLGGGLKLKEFTSLKRLDCSKNKLTNLDLSDCPELEKLTCYHNDFNNLNFLKFIDKLVELYINSCPSLKGSLEPLKHLTSLKILDISNTNISEGLEYLSESCKKFHCNSDDGYESAKFENELSRYSLGEGSKRYYNLEKWRENKQNDLAVSIISPERLFVIRSNLNQFINKWGEKKDDNLIELSKLQSPDELHKKYLWKIYTTRFIGSGAAVAGATLTFQNQSAIGGGILAVYPFTDLIVSKLEKKLEIGENRWKEFLTDANDFLDNFNGLLGMLGQFEVNKLKGGTINRAIKNLDKEVDKFLNIYDENKDKEIDINELTEKRDKLVEDIIKGKEGEAKSKVWEIIYSIKELEKAVIEYHRTSYYGTNRSNVEKSDTKQIKSYHTIDFDNYPEEKDNKQSQIEIPPKNQ